MEVGVEFSGMHANGNDHPEGSTLGIVTAETDGKDAPFDAGQYDFFGGGGGESGALGEIDELDGGLEEGVDAPPEEEVLEGALEDDILITSQASPSKADIPEGTSLTGAQPVASGADGAFASMDPDDELQIQASLLRLTEQLQAEHRTQAGTGSSSFFGDPVAIPPPRYTTAGMSSGTNLSAFQRMGPYPQAGQLQPPQQQQFGQRAGQIGMPQISQSGGSGQSSFLQQQGFPGAKFSAPVGRAATLEEIEARMLAAARPRPSRSPVPIPGAVTPRGGSFDLQRNSLDLMRGSYDPHRSSIELQRNSFSGVPTPSQLAGSPGGGFAVPARPGYVSGQGAYQVAQGGLAGGGRSPQMARSPIVSHMMQHPANLARQMSPLPKPNLYPSQQGSGTAHTSMQGPFQIPPPPQAFPAQDPHLGPPNPEWLQQQQQRQAILRQRQPPLFPQFGPGRGMPMRPHGDPMMHTPLQRRRLMGSKYMDAEEIESILRIQWKSLHSGAPYLEDYYYQAFVHKHRAGRNARLFAPEALRDLAPSEKVGAEPAMYVKLEGLGKIAYTNIRRPRPLMDLVAEAPSRDEGEGEEGSKAAARPLEEEPLLAARIVIEDCMCLLLDVDDIDRVWAASNGMREDEHLLRQRRSLLMDAFASSLRLPDGALPPAGSGRASDAVFTRLMALHKGRSLLARGLRLLTSLLASPAGYAGPAGRRPPPLRIVWAMLRNVRLLFGVGSAPAAAENDGTKDAAQRIVDATAKLATSAVDVMRRLESPRAICDSMAALVQGDLGARGASANPAELLLPLNPTGEAPSTRREWLAEVIIALLQRAQELGLADWAAQRSRITEGLAVPEGLAWRECFAAFFTLLARHLATLLEVATLATQAGALEAANYARQIVPINLIRAVLPHATESQRDQIRTVLAQLA